MRLRSALKGKRVLVTRAADQASLLVAALADRGAIPVELPTIAIEALTDYSALDVAIGRLSEYDWVVFTSVNGVKFFLDRVEALGRSIDDLGNARVGAIGPATAKALSNRGVAVALQPARYVAEAVVAALKDAGVVGSRILVPRALEAREVLVTELVTAGAIVDEIPVYQTVEPPGLAERARALFARREVDIVTFTSSSTVRNLISLLGGDAAVPSIATIACIGPITAQTATDLGLRVDVVAAEHTIPGLVRGLLDYEEKRMA